MKYSDNFNLEIMKLDAQETKTSKSFTNWFTKNVQAKSLTSDHNYSFNFKNNNWYLSVIYLISFIAIPIIYSLVKRYGFNIVIADGEKLSKPWAGLDIVFFYLIPLVGMSVSFSLDWKTMVKKGSWAAYSHFIFGFLGLIFVSILISTKILHDDSSNATFLAVNFFIQVLFQLLGSILVLLNSKQLRTQIWTTIKEAKFDLVKWIVIFFAFGALLLVVFDQISKLYQSSNDSNNEKNLLKMLSTPFGIFVFIIGTIFLAPINEEISYRYGTFNITANKSIGYIASLIYFPSLHVMQSGDWNNILGYMSMSIIAPTLFVFTRGNSTYNIGLHMMFNTIAVIINLVNLNNK